MNDLKADDNDASERVRKEIAFLRGAIEHYTCEFRETGNNLYCWLCIGAVFQLSQREQSLSGQGRISYSEALAALPFFCQRYLYSVSLEISGAAKRLNHPKAPASGRELAEDLPDMLGLTVPNWNAFTQYQRDQRQLRTALAHQQFRDEGLSSDEAAERVAASTNRSDERTIRRHVAAVKRKRPKH